MMSHTSVIEHFLRLLSDYTVGRVTTKKYQVLLVPGTQYRDERNHNSKTLGRQETQETQEPYEIDLVKSQSRDLSERPTWPRKLLG